MLIDNQQHVAMPKDATEEKLEKLGLNKNEQSVYIEIIKTGKISPGKISKLTKINRTTVYSITKKLADLGLVAVDIGGKINYLVAEDISCITRMLDREESALHKKRAVAKSLMRELSLLAAHKEYSIPRLKVIEESDLSEHLYKQYASWAESGERCDNIWWGFIDHSFTETYSKWIDWSWKHGPSGMKVKFLTNESASEKEMSRKHPDREILPLRSQPGFDASIWIIGDYVLMVKSRERPHYMIEISDTVLARNFREVFKNIWTDIK